MVTISPSQLLNKHQDEPVFLLVLTLVVSIASAYCFTFRFDLKGPSEDCDEMRDLQPVLSQLENSLASRGNDFLEKNKFTGVFANIHLNTELTRNLEEKDADEDMNLSDMELEELGHRQLWGFVWSIYFSGDCRGCPPDHGDKRRNLCALEGNDMHISKKAISKWVNKELGGGGLAAIIQNRAESESCKNSAGRWKGKFVWE